MTNACLSGKDTAAKAAIEERNDIGLWSNIWTLAVLISYIYQEDPLMYDRNCMNVFGERPCPNGQTHNASQALYDAQGQETFTPDLRKLNLENMECHHLLTCMLKFNIRKRPCIQACVDHPYYSPELSNWKWEENTKKCNNCRWTLWRKPVHCRACGESCCHTCCISTTITDNAFPQLKLEMNVKLCKNCTDGVSHKFNVLSIRLQKLGAWRKKWFHDDGTAKTFKAVAAKEKNADDDAGREHSC